MKGGAREKQPPPGGHIIVSRKKIVTGRRNVLQMEICWKDVSLFYVSYGKWYN